MNKLFAFYPAHPLFFIVLGIYIPLAIFWNLLRRRTNQTLEFEILQTIQPFPLKFGLFDYIKAFISWLFLFMRLFSVRPGFYYLGQQKENTPILVTSNNFLTVFLLARRIAQRSVRLLVINTNGINVWCSAGEGRFSAEEIIDKATRLGLLKEGQNIDMILPKLSLSGVKLSDLHKAGISPIIGPVYAKNLPPYLDKGEVEDCVNDRVHFGFQSRGFTALPTAFQFFYYFLGVYIITFWIFSGSIIWVATGLAFFYPILFPYLPGKQFAVKGISLGIMLSLLAMWLLSARDYGIQPMLFWTVFICATSMFIALSYTGNSPVSNYDNVRKETARFLPVVVLLYLLIIPVKIFL